MRYVVLGLLIFAPRTIYQLNKQFQVLLFYQASLGSIRTALQALVRDGNATVTETIENGRLKKSTFPRAPLPAGHSGLRHRQYGILREVSSGPHHIGSALSQ